MAWTEVLAANALTEGAREVVKVGERKILLLNHENQLYAVDDTCPHLKMSLEKRENRKWGDSLSRSPQCI
jgi:Ferredoxin subunits of nitrite reductase and ring-hydroxylating dioxygenases